MTEQIPVKDGLQLDDDHQFERADWRTQRIGWAVMALVLVLALAGGMGRGVLSDEQLSVGAADTLLLETVTRRHSETELKLKIRSASGDSLVIEIARPFLDHIELRDIAPEPVSTRLQPGGTQYVFGNSGQAPAEVRFIYAPTGYWRNRGWISVAGSGRVDFSQIILP